MGYRYIVQKKHMDGTTGHTRSGTTDLSKSEFEDSLKDDGTLSGDYEVILFEPLEPGETQVKSGAATPPKGSAAKAGTKK
jgi:hypothetical protein